MVKTTAIANPIQGLIKYHGMRGFGTPLYDLRIPFHDVISVAEDSLSTITTAETTDLPEDEFYIFDSNKGDYVLQSGRTKERIQAVAEKVRTLSGSKQRVKTFSINLVGDNPHSYEEVGKGVGYSSSAGASQAEAISNAFRLR